MTLFGLPLRAPRTTLAACALVFVVLVLTTSRSIGLFDEGELAVAAYELGLGHPTGQPLHVWLGFLASHLPGIAPVFGLSAMSALFAALTVVPTTALAERALPEDARPFVVPLVVVALALSGVVWEPSTRIEVYPIAAFFGLLAVAHAAVPERPNAAVVGLSLGLSASANPFVAVFAAIATVPLLFVDGASIRERAPRWSGAGILGLFPYLHLAIASRRANAFVWGGLANGNELVHYLTGRDYGGNLAAPLTTRVANAGEFLHYLADERGSMVAFLSALLGLAVLFTTDRRLLLSVLVLFASPIGLVASNAVFRVDVPDYLGYFAIGAMALAAPIAVAIDASLRRTRAGFVLAFSLVVASILASPDAFGRSRAHDDVTARVARIALDEAPRGAILVLESDHFVAPMLELQRVERVRPDVVVVARGLMSSSWYLRLLEAQHPSLRRYAVRGPGARDGRIRRLLDENPERDVRVEHLGLARDLGLVACASGLTFATSRRCEGSDGGVDLGPLLRAFARAHRLPSGSIDGHAIVTVVGQKLALDLERLGENRAAYAVLVASLPDRYRGRFLPPPTVFEDARPLVTGNPVFRRVRALAEPAQNAFIAARMLASVRRIDEAVELTRIAADDGLPEALELLANASR